MTSFFFAYAGIKQKLIEIIYRNIEIISYGIWLIITNTVETSTVLKIQNGKFIILGIIW